MRMRTERNPARGRSSSTPSAGRAARRAATATWPAMHMITQRRQGARGRSGEVGISERLAGGICIAALLVVLDKNL